MKKEVKTGIFALIVLTAGFITIDFLNGKNIFSNNNTFYTLYDRVDGLGTATNVMIKGFKVGIVSDIEYNQENDKYIVGISVNSKYNIPKDSRLEAYSSDIMGSRAIEIIPGTSSLMAADGDTLAGYSKADIITSVVSGILPMKDNIDSLLTNINTLINSVNSIVDNETKTEVKQILAGLEKSITDINAVTGVLNDKTPEIENTITSANTLARELAESATTISSVISNMETISNDIRDSDLIPAIDSLAKVITRIQKPDNSIGKLITSDSLYNSITSLSNSLDSLIKHIEKNPKKFIKFSVF